MRATKKIIILGGYGDGCVVAQAIDDVYNKDGSNKLIGYLNDNVPVGEKISDVPVLGKLNDWVSLDDDIYFISALHKVKKMEERAIKIKELKIPNYRWANIVHPTSSLSKNIEIGVGIFIGQNVVIQPGVIIGDHASIRAGANIGHDAKIGTFCYQGPNSTLCGKAITEEGAHLGPNSVVLDGKKVGCYTIIGIGSAVTKDTQSYSIYFGVPASKIGVLKCLK